MPSRPAWDNENRYQHEHATQGGTESAGEAGDGKVAAAAAVTRLAAWLEERGLKHSRQRDVIVETFYAMGGHVPVDGLVARVRALDARVSVATVYRTMKLLAECGIAVAAAVRRRADPLRAGQRPPSPRPPHLHRLRRASSSSRTSGSRNFRVRVARSHGFEVESHKLELYGRCERCRREPGTRDARS